MVDKSAYINYNVSVCVCVCVGVSHAIFRNQKEKM